MPLYDARMNWPLGNRPLGIHPGAEPFPSPCRVVDATGKQVPYCCMCNTETGWVERYDRGPDGKFVLAPGGQISRVVEMRPAPLTVVLLAANEPYLLPGENRARGQKSPGRRKGIAAKAASVVVFTLAMTGLYTLLSLALGREVKW